MKPTTQPHEVIYITAFRSSTQTEGDVITLFALDDFSKALFPFQTFKVGANDNQITEAFVLFLNGINKNYDRTKHAQSTTYYTDIPTVMLPMVKVMITPDSQIIHDQQIVQKAFIPVFQNMEKFLQK